MMRTIRIACCMALAVCLTLAAAACTSITPSQRSGHRVEGGIATISLEGGSVPNYIFPFYSPAYAAYPNPQGFQYLMYRPLYWTGDNNNPGIDYSESLADPPVYSGSDRTVTIKLKPWKWSDGSELSPADIAFWMGLEFTEKANYSNYTPGYFPDNVASVSYDNAADTVTFHLPKPVSPSWFNDNQLTQITPLPVAWDLEAQGQRGQCSSENLAAQKASCPAVYNYLAKQALNLSTYATNPLWQVVDGPWKLSSFSSDGHVTMVPNKSYGGPVKPSLSELKMVPYTSETSAYDAVRSGSTLSVGQVPVPDVPQANAQGQPVSQPLAPSYNLVPRYPASVDYAFLNYRNPSLAPLFNQLYIRQALQSTVDQSLYIQKALRGYGYQADGPVPLRPATSYLSSAEKQNPYPFSIAAARQDLTSHGWSIPSSGPAVCVRPGNGPGECGADISAGKKLVIPMLYPTNKSDNAIIAEQWASDASRAGIELNPSAEAYQALVGTLSSCRQASPNCTWGIGDIVGSLPMGIYPSGEGSIAAGAGFNLGGYDNPTMNQLIRNATTSPSTASLYAFEAYTAKQLPYIWMPVPAQAIYAIASNLRGVTPFNLNGALMPENWYFVN